MLRVLAVLFLAALVGTSFAATNTPQAHVEEFQAGINIPTINITTNETYGSTDTFSTFYLDGNMEIAPTGSMTFYNTLIEVTGAAANITINGSFRMYGSAILPLSSGNRLRLTTGSDLLSSPFMAMDRSRIAITGEVAFSDSKVVLWNSSISSALADPDSAPQTLTLGMSNSSLYAYNSSFSGLLRTNDSEIKDIASGGFYPSVPISSNTSISYTYSDSMFNSSLVTGLSANITYSVSNPTGENALLISYENNSYRYQLPSTGNANTYESRNVTLPINGTFNDLLGFENSLTTDMVMNSRVGSNSTVKSITLSLRSNDSVDILGQEYFSYAINGSSVYILDSFLNVDTSPVAGYSNLPNSHHDSLNLENSTLDLACSTLDDSGNTTFYDANRSSVNFFSTAEIRAHSGTYPVTGFTPAFHPAVDSHHTSSANSGIVAAERLITANSGQHFSQYSALLLSRFSNGSESIYTGMYNVSIYGGEYILSLPPYTLNGSDLVTENYSTDLPVVTAMVGARSVVEGTNCTVNLSIEDLSSANVTFN